MKAPEEKNFYTTNKDRQFHVREMIDWGTLGKAKTIDPEAYASFLEGTVGEVTGKRIALRAPKTEANNYTIEKGELLWSDEIKQSYRDLFDNDLVCTNVSEEYGGLGLPSIITTIISEMLFQADTGFATVPLLQSGVAEMIEEFGSEDLKKNYLEKMIKKGYTGCMDLTEPEAGSDLGGIRTKATQIDGDTYITGSKMFITNGGANIHLVLARDGDNYKETLGQTKGLSLYVVPRTINGKFNNVKVTKLEEKLGIHSSPTCEVTFEETDGKGAKGFLLGEKGKGLKYMLKLMNNARLGVAAQALGIIEASISDAKAYASERKQFGAEIASYGLVKDLLKDMQMYSEVIRSVVYSAAFATDMEKTLKKNGGSEDELRTYSNQAAILVPLIKYYSSEKAIDLARKGVQVHGGVGYTKEFSAEKYLRDSVITSIYEGTSEIQASLFIKEALTGKLTGQSRANLVPFLEDIDKGLEQITEDALAENVKKVKEANSHVKESLETLAGYIMQTFEKHPPYGDTNGVSSQAKKLADMTVEVYGGYKLLEQARKSDYKKTVANVFINDMLPRTQMYSAQIKNLTENTLNDYDTIIGYQKE